LTDVRKDPIFNFFNIDPNPRILFDTTKQIAKEIKLNHPNKQLLDEWGDGLALDSFFSGNYKNKLVITNNVIKCSPDQQKHIHTVVPTYYGQYFWDYPDQDVPIVKDFNCFINRFDFARQGWFYQLIRQGMIDHGYVSFNADLSRVPDRDFLGLTAQQAFDLGFQKANSIFAEEHAVIRSQIPYCNFEDTGDLTPYILGSKFSIILETFFHDNRIITFSEKTFRCLQLPRPWLLFSTQGGIEYLRSLGFDVLDDIVDHSYDSVEDPIQRQICMLKIAKELMLQTVPIARCRTAVLHNKNLLKSMRENWAVNIQQDFELARQKLLAL
jgi:hypothetical protein